MSEASKENVKALIKHLVAVRHAFVLEMSNSPNNAQTQAIDFLAQLESAIAGARAVLVEIEDGGPSVYETRGLRTL